MRCFIIKRRNLDAEEELILSLELGQDGDEVGLEQAGDAGPDEAV